MKHETLDEDIRARVPQQMKDELESLAEARHLKAADLIREALRDYLTKRKTKAAKS